MTIRELISRLESYSAPSADVVLRTQDGGLYNITDVCGLYHDPDGSDFVAIDSFNPEE